MASLNKMYVRQDELPRRLNFANLFLQRHVRFIEYILRSWR